MNLQGRIPQSAREIANAVQIDTAWQKYVVYDVLIQLALDFQQKTFELLPSEPTDHDTHRIDRNIFDGPLGHSFRKKHKAKNGAEFFRHAMHEGSSLIHLFLSRGLPADISPQQVFDAIARIIGANSRFTAGLAYLRKFCT